MSSVFDVADADPSPFVQFRRWFDEASAVMSEREAIALATATPEGRPSVRMVLLRHMDDHSFGWFTHYSSRKGGELLTNPHAALLWYCAPLGRQIRIEGSVALASPDASDAYFASRPRGHQLGAHASHQSDALSSRDDLVAEVAAADERFAGRDVPRPAQWGGFVLTPRAFEFWQAGADRLHDRVVYRPASTGWHRERLYP